MSLLERPNRSDSAYDLIIRSGTVIDGSGAPRITADVGVDNGFIVEIGDLSERAAATEIDATGLIVAPGFIDVHSHGTAEALRDATSSLTQGVTTEILQPDGGGSTNLAEPLSIADDGLAINIGAYIGFNAVWRRVVGTEDRRPTSDEIAHMQDLVVRGLQDGAWGVSAGLQYVPGFYARTDDVVRVLENARPWRTNVCNHIRSEENGVVEATAETIEIGEQAGLVPVITHMKIGGPANWGASVRTVGLIHDAIARGTYTAADVYPYLANQTGLRVRVPAWALDGGRERMLERFGDPAARARIAGEIETGILERTADFDGVYVPSRRKTLARIADDLGVGAGEAVISLLEADDDVYAITHFGVEDDLRRIMQNPTTAICSDGGATTSTTTHPRHYGSQPRVLGRYVRELGYLDLEDAVRRMTGLPAATIGVVDRGFLTPGMAADITVFDPDTVTDTATFDEPRQCADGTAHVVVNGRLALRDGTPTGVRAGAALRRRPDMISRPLAVSGRAAISGHLDPVDGSDDRDAHITASVIGDGAEPHGQFVFDHGRHGTFAGTRLGMLQSAPGWASITGRGHLAGEHGERSFSAIIDESDPWGHGATTVTLRVQGGYAFAGVLRTGSSRIEGAAR